MKQWLFHAMLVLLLTASWPATAGTPQAIGEQFQVNTYTTGIQEVPTVAVTADGGFVVVWASLGSSGSDSSSFSIQGRRFDSAGVAVGDELQVNTYTTNFQRWPAVAVAADDAFVVVWVSSGSSGSDSSATSIQGQRFDSAGAPVGAQFQINTYTTSYQFSPVLVSDADGAFVVVWTSDGSSGSDLDSYSIQGQRYDSAGAPIGTEFQVNTFTTCDQVFPTVAAAADGAFVVVWESDGPGDSDLNSYSIQGQRYDSEGAPIGGEFQVNTYTKSYRRQPAVATVGDGAFVVVWTSDGSSALSNKAWNLALIYGMSYSKSDLLKEFGERNFFTLIPAKTILEQKEELRLQHKKFNTKVIMYAFYYTKKARKKYPYLLSEEFTQAQLSLCRKALEQCSDFVWGVFTGDEHFPKLIKTLPEFKENPALWPEIENIEKEVRMKYGFGKFGIPEGAGDTNPFRWSAFYRWLVDEMIERQRKVFSLVKEVAPHVKVLSTDPSSHLWPFEFSRQAPYVDIFTAQMQPFANASNITDAGCRTKLYVDLTGKQFWPTPHFNLTTLGYTLTPEEVLDFCSVLAINGASGLHLYTKNHYPKNPYLNTFSFFLGAPLRAKAILTASDFLNNNQVQSNSEPDFAIFYSNESSQASREEFRTVHAYAFAGPVSESWFRFLDESTIKSKEQWLNKCKLIYLPYATFQSAEVANSLKEYVKRGGILFIGDPLAFSFDLNGEKRSNLREELTGCALAKGIKFQPKSLKTITLTNADFLARGIQGEKLPIQGPAWNLLPNKDTQILAKFDDGTPAIALHPYGAGKVIYAAYNFFPAYRQAGGKENRLDYRIINDAAWKKFFLFFHNKLGIKTKLDAWRFRLPHEKEVSDFKPGKFCLTDNFVEFENETAIPKNNKLINGVYFYNKSPNLIRDLNFNRLPFNLGKLTDRTKVIRRSSIVKPSEHIVQWSDARNLIINFEFEREVLFSGLRIIFSGLLPPVQVEVRTNKNSSFETVSSNSSRDVGVDISELSFSLEKPVNCTGVRINFLNNDESADLKISEVEIWGDEDKK